MDTKRVELSGAATVLIVLGVVATFGVLALFLVWMIRYRYPHVLDREGVTTRSGRRYLWTDVTEVLTIRRRDSRGLRITFASGGRIFVVPNMIQDPEGVLAYIEGCGIKSQSWR